MKILSKSLNKGEIKTLVENLDDLWYLSQIVDERDKVRGHTFRKIRIGDSENAKVIKKPVNLTIEVEKIEFHKYTGALRISGKVIEGPDDIGKGVHHTFDVNANDSLTIIKEKWLKYHLDKLQDASKMKSANVLIVAFDRGEASFALLKKYGYDMLSEIKGEFEKKADMGKTEKGKNFYHEILEKIEEYDKRYKLSKVIVASPAFWKDEFLKVVPKELSKKILLSTCADTGKKGVEEVLKRDEVRKAIQDERSVKESSLVDELFIEIKKEGKYVYGIEKTEEAAKMGMVKELMIVDDMITEMKQEGTFLRLNDVMKMVDNASGNVNIISSDLEAGRKLKGIGGIAAILRYKV